MYFSKIINESCLIIVDECCEMFLFLVEKQKNKIRYSHKLFYLVCLKLVLCKKNLW